MFDTTREIIDSLPRYIVCLVLYNISTIPKFCSVSPQIRRPQLELPRCQRRSFGLRRSLRKSTTQLLSPKGTSCNFFSGIILSVGGPALVYWVSPTEEELFKARL